MLLLKNRHWLLLGAVAMVIAAASVLVWPFVTRADAPTPVNTAAPVTKDQCSACHLNIGDVTNVPGLVFSHGKHLLYSCDTCHYRFPHRPGGYTDMVPMEACYACHGVKHGTQGELATSDCLKCHPSNFDLRPRTHHVADYAGKPHAAESKATGVNTCMMCHLASKDCNPCHEQQNVKIPKLPDTYHPIVYPKPLGPAIHIFPGGSTSMSQCVYCHPDIDAIKPGRLIFAHAAHLMRNYSCETCHPKFGHSPTGPVKPDMQSCYRCHGLYHNGNGLVAQGDQCNKCHPPGFQLVPTNHTVDFIKGGHKVRASADAAYCAMCHQPDFCIGCHQGTSNLPYAPTSKVLPADHKEAGWMRLHGSVFLAGKGACGTCHDDQSCRACHKTTMPHPQGWLGHHTPERGVPVSDCWICHAKDRNKCQTCHHQSTSNGVLVASACVGCHPIMAQKPATSIKVKAFAEHAVHFNVAKKKGKPYRCYECHVNYGTTAAGQAVALAGGHDLRLCYSCHGQLDLNSQLIAPYPGAELCRRCHGELGI